MSKIYLIHETTADNLVGIIESKELTPSGGETNQNPYDEKLSYTFFSCCSSKDFKTLLPYTLVFEIDVLLGKKFYTNKNHSAGNLKTSKEVPETATKKEIKAHLTTLLKQSRVHEMFMVFQEIFISHDVPISAAKYILLPRKDDRISEIRTLIKDQLPHVTVVWTK